jgi:beta-N-acetylhexosaminidase
MMICHGWYPCFEPEKTPATLSRRIVTDLLRDELGFDGLVMTDDLDMGAILTRYRLEDTIRLAIAAGNDVAMICHRIPEIENVQRILATLPQDQIDRALQNVARFKERLTPRDEFSEAAFRKIDDEIWDLRVAVLGEEHAGQATSQSVQRSPVEMF